MTRLTRRELLQWSAALGGASAVLVRCGPDRPPNVLLVTLDTTRADRLGCYGYPRDTSPNIDALATKSVLHRNAIAASSWTLPAHASLFTGKYTASHGARYHPEGPLKLTDGIEGPRGWEQYRARGLAIEEKTLALRLRQAGYRTGAVVGGPWLKRVFGLDRGFEEYDDSGIRNVAGRLASEITAAASTFVARDDERPFFLFLNYYDPHSPYGAPEPYRTQFFPRGVSPSKEPDIEELSDRYDGEIRYMDTHLGRLFDRIKELGLYERTLILVTADHGELFGEHGKMGHGNTLFQEEVHVPLLVKYPEGESSAGSSDRYIHQIDVLPLIFDRLGLAIPAEAQGAPPQARRRAPLLSEVYPLALSSEDGDWRALYLDDRKFLWNSLGNHHLFDLAADPRETIDLAPEAPQEVERRTELLDELLATLPPPGDPGPARDLDPETLDALRSLGYIQ